MVIEAAIQAERARYINRNVPTAAIGSFFVASILLIMYWGSVQAVILVAWLVLTAAIGLYRLSVWQTFRRAELTPDVLSRRFRQELLGAGFSGCSWGMGFFILLSQGPLAFQFAALFTMVVLAVLAMFSYGAYFPAFRMFFLPSVTPVFLVFVLRWTILDGTFAIGTAAFVVALWIMAVRI